MPRHDGSKESRRTLFLRSKPPMAVLRCRPLRRTRNRYGEDLVSASSREPARRAGTSDSGEKASPAPRFLARSGVAGCLVSGNVKILS